MWKMIILTAGLISLSSAGAVLARVAPAVPPADSSDTPETVANDSAESVQIVVYYLHLNRRCITCGKLESYSREAVESGFAEQLHDSSIVWRIENFEQEGNEHFAKDYNLYSQSLILSRHQDGKETEWKKLDDIWQLVGDKEKFVTYVQSELQAFMMSTDKE